MNIQIKELQINTDHSVEHIKNLFGYTDKVHRLIDGNVVEIDNPLSVEETINQWVLGMVNNKLNETSCKC